MGYPDTAEGFMVQDQKPWDKLSNQEYKLKTFEDHDVDITIDCCGVCGSGIHTLTDGWGEVSLPVCVGHEIIGTAVKVGKAVKNIKVVDRAGAGAQIGADIICTNCKAN